MMTNQVGDSTSPELQGKYERLLTQLEQRFTSEVLWHFTGRNKSEEEAYRLLLSILESGALKKGDKNSEFKFFDTKTKRMESLEGFPVSCLADIPFKDLPIHARRYGACALGFHKASAIDNNFCPVMYVNQFAPPFHQFIGLRDEVEKYLQGNNQDISDKFTEMLYFLGSVVKGGNLKANPVNDPDWDKMQVNNFYYEREWRSVYDWFFKKEDLAMVILPDSRIKFFLEDRKKKTLNISEETPVIPFSMVYSL